MVVAIGVVGNREVGGWGRDSKLVCDEYGVSVGEDEKFWRWTMEIIKTAM